MPGRNKQDIPCADCGQVVRKVNRVDRAILCLECGIRRATQAAQEMAAKRGPAWDAWLASNGPRGRTPSTGNDRTE